MKLFKRHIAIVLFVFYGLSSYASHVMGGEITYKHIKNNQYAVTLTIFRDCNGCKINGTGGGNSKENCSEIDFLIVKGSNTSGSKEYKFALKRERIIDITPNCKNAISICQSNANSAFGIEVQEFNTIVDLDHSAIQGFCDYYLYISIAERNSDISTGQASQNFCIDAYINACGNGINNSPNFESYPSFIVNSNENQYLSFHSSLANDDSIAYSLTPALSNLGKAATYGTGFSPSNPLSAYCPSFPCKADKTKEPPVGFYLDPITGENIFVPTKNSERGIVAIKVEWFRKNNSTWELMGYIKRDIQIYVKNSDGNHSPKLISEDYYEICEEEVLSLKIEAEDEKNFYTNILDTLSFSVSSSAKNYNFSEEIENNAPYRSGLLKWKPARGDSKKGIFTFSVEVRDNHCPLNAISTQIIKVKVLPKESLLITQKDLGCGNYEISSNLNGNVQNFKIKIISISDSKVVYQTSLSTDTVGSLPLGNYLIEGSYVNTFGCLSTFTDTIKNLKSLELNIIGDSLICQNTKTRYNAITNFIPASSFNWYIDSNYMGTGNAVDLFFTKNAQLGLILSYSKGKFFCKSQIFKPIKIKAVQAITGPDEINNCYNSNLFDLTQISMSPNDGHWISNSVRFNNQAIQTNDNYPYYNDTVIVMYQRNDICNTSKEVKFILKALPEFELSDISICEMATPIRLVQLVKKPFKTLDYTYTWELENNQQNLKNENGYAVIYPSDLGFGTHKYSSEITSIDGCTNRDTASIEITPAIKIKIEQQIEFCQNSGAIDIIKEMGISPSKGNWSFIDFQLFDNNTKLLTDTCGIFKAKYIYDQYGCYDEVDVDIKINCKPLTSSIELDKTYCSAELPLVLEANPKGGTWQGAFVTNNIFNPIPFDKTKQYSVKYLFKQNGCEFNTDFNLKIEPSPTISVFTDKQVYCDGEDIFLNGEIKDGNFLQIQYLNSEHKDSIPENYNLGTIPLFKAIYADKLKPHVIDIAVGNASQCKSSAQIFFDVLPIPIISGLRDTTICEGTSVELSPSILFNTKSDLNYKWFENGNLISNKKSISWFGENVGQYKIRFEAASNFCQASQEINVKVNPSPKVDFKVLPSSTSSILQPTFQFINHSELGLDLLWDFGLKYGKYTSSEENPQYSYTDTGNYEVVLRGTNSYGCSSFIVKNIIVKPDILIFIPNAFSPDGKNEEKNNVFGVSIESYSDFSIEIFDRWGHKVYASTNPKETWDGKSGNVQCTPDVYFYSIKVNSVTQNPYHYKGTITLIR